MSHRMDESTGLYLPNKFEEAMKNNEDNEGIRQFLESLAKLELQLEDTGWKSLADSSDRQDFSTKGRNALQNQAYLYWLKNPLLGRAVETKTNYVYGNGFSYKAEDENVQEILDGFMDDEDNKRELTTLQAQQMKSNELQIFGNIYLVFFVSELTGKVKVRSLPSTEIKDIITDPDDAQKPLWYKRVRKKKVYDFKKEKYKMEREVKYYADWKQPDDLNGMEPPQDEIAGSDSELTRVMVYHIKVNCLSNNKFGISELYRAMDWAKAYNKFLEDLASVWETLSKFAIKNKVKGTSKDIQNQANKLKEALNSVDNTGQRQAGGILHENMGSEMESLNVRGASLDADDGRRLLLMVSAATGLIEPFFGDPSTANLATMEAMMGPMLKIFGARQELWKSIWRNIFDFVIDCNIEAPQGELNGYIEEDAYGNEYWEIADETDRSFEIDFPEMVEEDIPDLVSSVKEAAETYLIPEKELSRILMNLFDIDNVDKVLEEMYPEGETEPQITHDGEIDLTGEDEEVEEALLEAVKEIKKRIVLLEGEKSA